MEALRLTPLDPLVIALRFAAALGLGVLLLPGQRGLYLAGAIAGLTDVDAITLSMAELARAEGANPGSASLTIVIAVASNTLFKAGVVTS